MANKYKPDGYEVPDLSRQQLFIPLLGKKNEEERLLEALEILKLKVKPNLTLPMEKQLKNTLMRYRCDIRKRRAESRTNMAGFLEKYDSWLSRPIYLSNDFKPVKNQPDEIDAGLVRFRELANYCFICSTSLTYDLSLPITQRLAKSISTAMNLKSTPTIQFISNLIDCCLCTKCYDKVIEVNDCVKELEQIQLTLHGLSDQLDRLLASGMETHKTIPVALHGVNESYITPIELRKEIIKSRKEDELAAFRQLHQSKPTQYNTTTRRTLLGDKEKPASFLRIASVASLASRSPSPNRSIGEGSHDSDETLSCVEVDFSENSFTPKLQPSKGSRKRKQELMAIEKSLKVANDVGSGTDTFRPRILKKKTGTLKKVIARPRTTPCHVKLTKLPNTITDQLPSSSFINVSSFDFEQLESDDDDQYQLDENVQISIQPSGKDGRRKSAHCPVPSLPPVQHYPVRLSPPPPPENQLLKFIQSIKLNLPSNEVEEEVKPIENKEEELKVKPKKVKSVQKRLTTKQQYRADRKARRLKQKKETLKKIRKIHERKYNVNLLRCKVTGCRYATTDGERLSGHVHAIHLKVKKPYKCMVPLCEEGFRTYKRLASHKFRSHGISNPRITGRAFQCDQCHASFNREHELTRHRETAHFPDISMVTCSTCGKVCSSVYALKGHSKTHAPKTLTCPSVAACGATFRYPTSVRLHQGRCHPEEFPELVPPPRPVDDVKVICDECGKLMANVASLNKHIQRKHTAAPEKSTPRIRIYKCPARNCSFTSKILSEVRAHRDTHTDSVPRYVCSEPSCAKGFYHLSSFKDHEKRYHDPNYSKPMCPHCGIEISTQHGFRRHLDICLGKQSKSHVCPQCHVAFATERYLKRHKEVKPDCKPQEPGPGAVYCTVCNQCCSSNNSLGRHMQLIHNSGEKPWRCSACGKTFGIKMYLTRHLRESKYCPASSSYQEKVM